MKENKKENNEKEKEKNWRGLINLNIRNKKKGKNCIKKWNNCVFGETNCDMTQFFQATYFSEHNFKKMRRSSIM